MLGPPEPDCGSQAGLSRDLMQHKVVVHGYIVSGMHETEGLLPTIS